MKKLAQAGLATVATIILTFTICYYVAPNLTQKATQTVVAFVSGMGGKGDQLVGQ